MSDGQVALGGEALAQVSGAAASQASGQDAQQVREGQGALPAGAEGAVELEAEGGAARGVLPWASCPTRPTSRRSSGRRLRTSSSRSISQDWRSAEAVSPSQATSWGSRMASASSRASA